MLSSMDRIINTSLSRVSDSLSVYNILENGSNISNFIKSTRKDIINWMIEISIYTKHSRDARDTAIQIFDAYLSKILQRTPYPDHSLTITFKMDALVCYVLSFKILDVHISLIDDFLMRISSTFPIPDKLIPKLEIFILYEINFEIFPLATPSAFYRKLFSDNLIVDKTFLAYVDCIVADCYKNTVFLQFVPSTIAIASVVYSCSMFQIDCQLWLQNIPDCCFFDSNRPDLTRVFDVSACVDLITKSHMISIPAACTPEDPNATLQSPTHVVKLVHQISATIPPKKQFCDGIFDTILQSVAYCDSMDTYDNADDCAVLLPPLKDDHETFAIKPTKSSSIKTTTSISNTSNKEEAATKRKRSIDGIYSTILQSVAQGAAAHVDEAPLCTVPAAVTSTIEKRRRMSDHHVVFDTILTSVALLDTLPPRPHAPFLNNNNVVTCTTTKTSGSSNTCMMLPNATGPQ